MPRVHVDVYIASHKATMVAVEAEPLLSVDEVQPLLYSLSPYFVCLHACIAHMGAAKVGLSCCWCRGREDKNRCRSVTSGVHNPKIKLQIRVEGEEGVWQPYMYMYIQIHSAFSTFELERDSTHCTFYVLYTADLSGRSSNRYCPSTSWNRTRRLAKPICPSRLSRLQRPVVNKPLYRLQQIAMRRYTTL